VLYTTPAVIAASFIVGGIVMILVERYRPRPVVEDADRTSLGRAFGIGCCQALALVPGVSRSGATIVGAMLFGIDRPAAAEFSFFLAIPTMSAAFAHELWGARHGLAAARREEIAIGFVMAFIASALVIRPFLGVVRRAGFTPFAWYRIAAGVAIAAALVLKLL
jgi:undecaprenyl-diphosphatase